MHHPITQRCKEDPTILSRQKYLELYLFLFLFPVTILPLTRPEQDHNRDISLACPLRCLLPVLPANTSMQTVLDLLIANRCCHHRQVPRPTTTITITTALQEEEQEMATAATPAAVTTATTMCHQHRITCRIEMRTSS